MRTNNYYKTSKHSHKSSKLILLLSAVPIGVHAVELKNLPDASCISYLEEDKVEIYQHFFLDYTTFASSVLKHLRFHTVKHSVELAGAEMKRLNGFVKG